MTFTENHAKNPENTKGNALVYVLIALALIGVLTMTLASQNEQSDGQDIDDEILEIYANELIEYMNSAQQVVDMMISTGSEVRDLNFVNPTSTGFDTGSHIHKVFHPEGGGLNYIEKFNPNIRDDLTSAWVINNSINVEWSETTGNDAILTAYFVTQNICEILNLKITGSTTIPATAKPHSDYFLPNSQ
ncbi:MAG: hypothetical protein MRY79_06260, partial [Alphaproteobacteria bacterium]|nr:hypothetical protein [Alphaproteobacteria bacterium]